MLRGKNCDCNHNLCSVIIIITIISIEFWATDQKLCYSDLAIMNWAECSWATLDTCYQNLVRKHTQTKSAGKLTHLTLWYAHVRGVSGGKIH